MGASRKRVAGGEEAGCEVENTFDHVKRDCVVRPRFADAGREDEAKNSSARFLVGTHGAEERRRRNARPGGQWSEAANQRDDAGNIVRARQAEFVPEESSSDHAPGYRFTVLVTAIFGYAFESMGEGVTVVEDFPQAGFAFVTADDAGFDPHIAGNKKPERRAIPPQHFFHVLFKTR